MVKRRLAEIQSEQENTQRKDVCLFSVIARLLTQVLRVPHLLPVVNLSYLGGEVSLGAFRLAHFGVLGLTVCKVDQLEHVLRVEDYIFQLDI